MNLFIKCGIPKIIYSKNKHITVRQLMRICTYCWLSLEYIMNTSGKNVTKLVINNYIYPNVWWVGTLFAGDYGVWLIIASDKGEVETLTEAELVTVDVNIADNLDWVCINLYQLVQLENYTAVSPFFVQR